MNEKRKESLYQLLLDLVGIPSVSPSGETENRIARFIHDRLEELPYFKRRPEDLRLLPLEGDPHGRHLVFAMVRAERETADTVILMGHMDVVGVDGCGPLAPFAFQPEEYTRRLASADISPDARKDLETGQWLFGRGVADMKSGVAVGMDLFMEAAGDPGKYGANVAVLFVPDEEINSLGMLSASSYLARFQKEEGLNYLACVDLEPTFALGEEGGPTIYLGTLGKINCFFFCAGKEAHAGEYYEGFSPAPILSRINLALEGNPAFADSFQGRIFPPFGCQRQTDLREEYSVTIMTKGFAFYNYLTSTRQPEEVLSDLKSVALEALEGSIEQYRKNAGEFMARGGALSGLREWEPTVLSFAELVRLAREILGEEYESFVAATLGVAPPKMDERDLAARLVDAMVDRCRPSAPVVVVGFLPPWYPHRVSLGAGPGERVVEEAALQAVKEMKSRFGLDLEIRPFFEGISDLSYCGFQGDRRQMEVLADNMPGWGRLYRFPLDALAELDIPILNLGAVGKDAHKCTERVHLPYMLEVYPEILRFVVGEIIEGHRP
ncbi:MAG: M20/M25/M40 family metallo-hydrolase [Thermovirgaceae bacterium]|jgi:arginine utilization protein RocB|nr:M20/M25/M40 family metallo-hydrolase [Thermovirga sp.]